VARDAVWSEWSEQFVAWLQTAGFIVVASAAPDRATYVRRPPLGRVLPAAALAEIRRRAASMATIQLVLSDGLSASAAGSTSRPSTKGSGITWAGSEHSARRSPYATAASPSPIRSARRWERRYWFT
jgi:ethanolamine ammonia-lyase small subunit